MDEKKFQVKILQYWKTTSTPVKAGDPENKEWWRDPPKSNEEITVSSPCLYVCELGMETLDFCYIMYMKINPNEG